MKCMEELEFIHKNKPIDIIQPKLNKFTVKE